MDKLDFRSDFKVFHLNIIVFSDVLDSGEKFRCYDVMYLDLNYRVCLD